MYAPGMAGVGDFGRLLLASDKLSPGNQYTFTFEHGNWIEISSSGDVQDKLRYFMQNYGDILKVDRALFSGRYVVVVAPKGPATLPQWLNAFDYSWKNMGYGDAKYISTEEGTVSTQPGGVSQIFTGASEVAGESIYNLLKPFIPYLIGGVILMMVIPSLTSSVSSALSKRRA